jgi:hypothetical protein
VKFANAIGAIWQWLPLPAIALFAAITSDWFARWPDIETCIVLALLLLGNLVMILVERGLRKRGEFQKKFPGFKA